MPIHPTEQAIRALTHRLRAAAAESWDADRCEIEARSLFAEMRQRGWAYLAEAASWHHRPRRRFADPAVIAARASEAREAIRANRPTTSNLTDKGATA